MPMMTVTDRFSPTFGRDRGRGDTEPAARVGELPVYNFLDLATAHLLEAEMEALLASGERRDPDDALPRVIAHEYGLWMHVPAVDDAADQDAQLARLWPNLHAVMTFARAHQCWWVNFDQDAATCEHLPAHEW